MGRKLHRFFVSAILPPRYNRHMRNRRIWKMVLAAAMAAGAAGCAKTPAGTDRNIKDGTYTAEAQGYAGPVSAEVKILSGSIQSVRILAEQESMTIADAALTDTCSRIVSAQSVNVDLSTGATITSQAVIDAVSDCIGQAGGSLEKWQKDAVGTDPDEVVTEEYQAAVVGGGISGIAAALRLEQLGISTVLIEKTDEIGQSLYYTDGLQIVTGSTLMESGSMERLQEEINAVGNNEADSVLQELFTSGIADTVNWEISDLGVKFSGTLTESTDYSVLSLAEMSDSPESLQTLFEKELKVSGAKVLTETMVYELLQEGGRITGVMAKASDGTVYEIHAGSVILATGSYAGSGSLLPDVLYCGPAGDTGDMLVLGGSDDLQFARSSETGYETLWPAVQADGSYALDAYDAVEEALSAGAFIVNGEGRRFSDETDYEAVLDGVKDGVSAYLVMDGDTYGRFLETLLQNASADVKEALTDPENGLTAKVKADTVRAAAELAGIDPDQLYASYQTYQRSCTAGADPEYQREPSTLKALEQGAGYVVLPLQEAVWATLGGISADENLNVKRTDGSVWNNVYVIGAAAGNVFGTGIPEGAGTTWAFVSAKAAADRIAAVTAASSSVQPEAAS